MKCCKCRKNLGAPPDGTETWPAYDYELGWHITCPWCGHRLSSKGRDDEGHNGSKAGIKAAWERSKRGGRRGSPSPGAIGSAKAFRKWRGKKPTTGYGYDLMKWEYETRDMRLAWDAAVAWCLSYNREVTGE